MLRSRNPRRVTELTSSVVTEVAAPMLTLWSVGLGVITFLGAFLLFQVQPLVGNAVLPWFGGAPGAWIVAMLFFQTALVGGYALVHFATRHLTPHGRTVAFVAVAAAAALLLPILPRDVWKPRPTDDPVLSMLLMLAACVGGPYLALSMTGPMVQEWHHRAVTGGSPYRLYALSNLGSLLGLITYPLAVEPALDLRAQSRLWSCCYIAYVGLAAVCAWWMPRRAYDAKSDAVAGGAAGRRRVEQKTVSVTARDAAIWIGLAAAGSTMLLAVTNHLCQDLPSVPFMWIGPMVSYLSSFIICFDRPQWCRRELWGTATVILVPITCMKLESFAAQATLHLLMLFAVCMLCHGELAKRRPAPQQLTLFYLLIAVGGALGGLFVGVVAPLIYERYWEWMAGTVGAFLFGATALMQSLRNLLPGRIAGAFAVAVPIFGVVGIGFLHREQFNRYEVEAERNFYGVIYLDAGFDDHDQPEWVAMRSGSTVHGSQFLDAERRRLPTTYYGVESGIGHLLRAGGDGPPRHIGVVGLGGGTLAAYGRPVDRLRFYEINPAVVSLAKERFRYLGETPSAWEIVLGDARLSLERETPQEFDVLVLDAFSSDSVPTHLLTLEAFGVYLRHLRADGVIAAHVSNQHLHLSPILAAAARRLALSGISIYNAENLEEVGKASLWVLLTRRADTLVWQRLMTLNATPLESIDATTLWTDHFKSLLPLLK